jgi:hypothetical protein
MSKQYSQRPEHDAAPCGPQSASPRSGRRGLWVFLGFVAVAGFFLLTEHRAHLFGILPYLLLLACPLMHLFHHGGHGGHGGHGSEARDKAEGEKR